MKNLLHNRNTTRPLGGSTVVRETLGSVLPGSAITPTSGGRLYARWQSAVMRGAAVRFC